MCTCVCEGVLCTCVSVSVCCVCTCVSVRVCCACTCVSVRVCCVYVCERECISVCVHPLPYRHMTTLIDQTLPEFLKCLL